MSCTNDRVSLFITQYSSLSLVMFNGTELKLNATGYFFKRGGAVLYVLPCFPVSVEITSTH